MEKDVKLIIADIALNFASIEYACTQALAYAISNELPGSILGLVAVQDMNLEQKLQKLRKIAELKYGAKPDWKDYIIQIVRDISQLKSERNKFIHGLWKFDSDRIECIEMKWKKKDDTQWTSRTSTVYTIDQLRKLRDRTASVSHAAEQMAVDVYNGQRN